MLIPEKQENAYPEYIDKVPVHNSQLEFKLIRWVDAVDERVDVGGSAQRFYENHDQKDQSAQDVQHMQARKQINKSPRRASAQGNTGFDQLAPTHKLSGNESKAQRKRHSHLDAVQKKLLPPEGKIGLMESKATQEDE